jgi:hypothetical protein
VTGPIVAFLTTGRCGTQWLAGGLRERYGERIEVEHEPLGPLYRPREFFRRYDDPGAILAVPEVREHVDRIARSPFHVETGWPLFPALPLLAERFPERLRVVHLTRHPVPTALSHLAHNSYAGSPRDDAYTRLATLGPSDANVLQANYAARWDSLTPYERCLFWWTEVNAFGLEWEERFGGTVPFLRVRAEEMLAGSRPVLERLVEFMGLPWDESWVEQAERVVDRWHHHTDQDVDPLLVREHPLCVEAAARLGYDVSDLDVEALEARYRGEPDPGTDRIGRFA